ncbi:MAG: sulfotransferase [Alphaproteobacteria bacterium]
MTAGAPATSGRLGPRSMPRAETDMPGLGLHTLPREALDRLVYMVGSPRGGTTVIYRAFRLSDRVFDFPGITHFMSHVWKHRNRVHDRLLQQIFKIPDFYHERQILDSLEDAKKLALRRYIRDAFASRDLGRMYQVYPLVYALDPGCAKDPARVRCWVDKANDVYGLFDIPRSMPGARFVFITRDPRGANASMRRQVGAFAGEEDEEEKSHDSLIASCIYWRHMMQTLLRFAARYPDRTRFVRYEDFMLAPEDTINGLLEFAAGESMAPEALRQGMSRFKHSVRHDPSIRETGIDTRPMTRWQQMLSDQEIELVSALTGPTARKLGYDPGPASSPLAVARAVLRLKGTRRRLIASAKLAFLEAREPLVPSRPASGPVVR